MKTVAKKLAVKQTALQIVEMHIGFELSRLDKDIIECKSKLDEDFLYNFSWGLPKTLYISMRMKQILTRTLEAIKKSVDFEELKKSNQLYTTSRLDVLTCCCLEDEIAEKSKWILKGGFTGTSSGTFHNLAHTFDKEVDCIIIEKYKSYLELINQTK